MKSICQKYFEFTTFIEALKKMERFRSQFYWKDYPQLKRYESVADHTWRLGILLILFEKRLKSQFNITKALKMALIHDLPEIISGDDSPMGSDGTGQDSHAYNKKVAKERKLKEQSSSKKLFSILPNNLSKELIKLSLEYENQESIEAKIVKALDRIECMLQVLEYRDGFMFPKHLEFTINYALEKAQVDPTIKEFGEYIASELKSRFKEFKIK